MTAFGLLYEETERFLRRDVFCAPIAKTIEAELTRAGHAVRVINHQDPENDLADLSGVIYLAGKYLERAQNIRQVLPLVAVLPDFACAEGPAVVVEDEEMGISAAQYFLHAKRKKLVVLSGHEQNGAMPAPYRRRVDAFTSAARAGGAEVECLSAGFEHVYGSSGATASRKLGDQFGLELVGRDPRPDGIWAVNDHIASEVALWFREKKIPVPEETSILGSDNLPTSGKWALSTIHVPKAAIGRAAVEMRLASRTSRVVEVRALRPAILHRRTTRER